MRKECWSGIIKQKLTKYGKNCWIGGWIVRKINSLKGGERWSENDYARINDEKR